MKSYEELEKKLQECNGKIRYIGMTYLGHPIPLLEKGKSRRGRILLVGGVHAREYITSYLLLELMKNYEGKYRIDCIPALNIDGILLSRLGKNLFLENSGAYEELRLLNGNSDFSQWKANIRGVDINVNFDADWGEGRQNVRKAGSENYIGEYPESEKETKAIVELLGKKNYDIVIAYHSKGEEIYYGYGKDVRNYEFAKKVADFLGYKLSVCPNSAGGLKDYYIKKYGGFGLTVEVGEERFSHPYPMEELDKMVKLHTGSLELFGEIGEELWKKNLCSKQLSKRKKREPKKKFR